MAALCRSYDSHGEALEAVKCSARRGHPRRGRAGPHWSSASGDAHARAGRRVRRHDGARRTGRRVRRRAPRRRARADRRRSPVRPSSAAGASPTPTARSSRATRRAWSGCKSRATERITRLLTDAGLDEATAKRDVETLHQGAPSAREYVDRVDAERLLDRARSACGRAGDRRGRSAARPAAPRRRPPRARTASGARAVRPPAYPRAAASPARAAGRRRRRVSAGRCRPRRARRRPRARGRGSRAPG